MTEVYLLITYAQQIAHWFYEDGFRYKCEPAYNSQGNLTSLKARYYHVDYPNDIYEIPTYSYEIDYNEKGKPVLINGFKHDEPNRKIEYQYDSNDNIVLLEGLSWDSENNDWYISDDNSKHIAFYDSQNRIIQEERYGGQNKDWYLEQLNVYNYDENGHVSTETNSYSIYDEYPTKTITKSDENGNTTTYNYIFKDDKWQVDGYTISYPNQSVPEAEVDNNNPVDSNQGGFDIDVNIPTDSINNGNITITLPNGFTLDEENTTLTLDFAGLFELTITKQENNSWLIEINPKSIKSAALTSAETTRMLHVAYKVDETLVKGTYDISINNILFETKGGSLIPEPAITVPVDVNRWGVGNEYVSGKNTAVYASSNTLYIQTSQTENIAVYAPTGIKLYDAKIQSGTTTIDAANFPKGVLFVKGSSGWSKKVVLQ